VKLSLKCWIALSVSKLEKRTSKKGMQLDYFVGNKNLVDGNNKLQEIARDS
jgi:hypothetical protein